jgi:hypothetical protein
VTRKEALQATAALAASPAAKWIGNKIVDGQLIQKCMRCGSQEVLAMPVEAMKALQRGARGDALARLMPADFDEKLYTWKRAFQNIHESCTEHAA